jgi:hypothetical protein
MAAAEKAEAFYLEEAKKQDAATAEVFADNGVEIAEMSQEEFDAWRAMAQETSYKALPRRLARRSEAARYGAFGRVIPQIRGRLRTIRGRAPRPFPSLTTESRPCPVPPTPRPPPGTGQLFLRLNRLRSATFAVGRRSDDRAAV